MSVKINEFSVENVKRVRAVRIEPTKNGLTVIGGKNNQGKTSVLDALAWALGGDKYKPSAPEREGSVIPPYLQVKLSNGIVVERKGKNSDLKVIDPTSQHGGQQLLNDFVEQLALDLPKFMNASGKEKADTLLRIIGVGDQLYELERQENDLYNRRRYVGQVADQKVKFAKEMPEYIDAPSEPVSATELIRQQQDILAKNGENQRLREHKGDLERKLQTLQDQINALQRQFQMTQEAYQTACRDAQDLQDESTAELEASIRNIEAINVKVRANLDKQKAEEDARNHSIQYEALTDELEKVRKQKAELLNSATLPLPGLSVEDGELIYNGQKWDNMSSSDQLKVATAIIRKLKPDCGFVLLDKLEQMDLDTLQEFGAWLESEGLQAIATRVSTGGECSIIIEDGYVKGEPIPEPSESEEEKPKWQKGVF